MKKIHELFGKPLLKGDVGIEIEAEGPNVRFIETDNWRSEDDGSLRGIPDRTRAEYVMRWPVPIAKVKDVLKEFKEATKEMQFKFSFRTSVHVHINVLDMTEDQVFNMIYTYLLLEEPLVNYCGKERKCNRFCLRLQDSEELSTIVHNMMVNGIRNEALGEGMRYAAINLASLNKYGSIEFRSMRGTADEKVISTWCSALVAIRSFAKKHKDVKSIFDKFIDSKPLDFLKEVLGDYADPFIYPKMDKDMNRSFSLAMDIPFTQRVEKVVEEPKPRRRAAAAIPADMVWEAAPAHLVNLINPGN